MPDALVAVAFTWYWVHGANVAVHEPCHTPLVVVPELRESDMVFEPLSPVIAAVIDVMGLPFVSRAVTYMVCKAPTCILNGSISTPIICGWPPPLDTL